jgi:hypothetical protein
MEGQKQRGGTMQFRRTFGEKENDEAYDKGHEVVKTRQFTV